MKSDITIFPGLKSFVKELSKKGNLEEIVDILKDPQILELKTEDVGKLYDGKKVTVEMPPHLQRKLKSEGNEIYAVTPYTKEELKETTYLWPDEIKIHIIPVKIIKPKYMPRLVVTKTCMMPEIRGEG
ncbi:MAG: hypothetical protein JSW73_00390 [Candidatus Woesearchaeota archaeon]|nr:MAG: hypothetical protein JSW73_00390 [Candidatus Woesearchaeota archaeon]